MSLQVEMPQNGTKKIFSNKKTTSKVPLMFLNFKVVTER